MIKAVVLVVLAVLTTITTAQDRPPVLDVHLHAMTADAQGPPPLFMCTPIEHFPAVDPGRQAYPNVFMALMKNPPCDDPIESPLTDDALLRRTIAQMEAYNVYGILSGGPERVADWMEAAPGRFIPGLGFNVANTEITRDELAALFESGRIEVLAEITNQYSGVAPDDDRMAPFWSLAEEMDIPVGIHIGPGPPGVHHLGSTGYRARLHSALTLEPVLVKYPKLRVYIMHAGFPMLDDLLAVMYSHPQVYAGLGVISFTQPEAAFYRYLRGIVDAGFGKRVMFGSDQMVWPETIGRAIERIENAPFLDADQKRDILYNNAARFLRLDEEEIARHHEK